MRVGPDNGTPNSTESIISIPSHASGWIYFQLLNGIHIHYVSRYLLHFLALSYLYIKSLNFFTKF